jgi:hypothetical protein
MTYLLDDGFDVIGRSVRCRHKSGGRTRRSWGLLKRMKSVQTVQLTIRNKKSTTLACDDWSMGASAAHVHWRPAATDASSYLDGVRLQQQRRRRRRRRRRQQRAEAAAAIRFLAFDRSYREWIDSTESTRTFYNRELVLMVDVTSRPCVGQLLTLFPPFFVVEKLKCNTCY